MAGAAAIERLTESEQHAHLAQLGQPILRAADRGEFQAGDLVGGQHLVFGQEGEKSTVTIEETKPRTRVRMPAAVHATRPAAPFPT
nr:hypothetical protein [Nocardia seriolae]